VQRVSKRLRAVGKAWRTNRRPEPRQPGKAQPVYHPAHAYRHPVVGRRRKCAVPTRPPPQHARQTDHARHGSGRSGHWSAQRLANGRAKPLDTARCPSIITRVRKSPPTSNPRQGTKAKRYCISRRQTPQVRNNSANSSCLPHRRLTASIAMSSHPWVLSVTRAATAERVGTGCLHRTSALSDIIPANTPKRMKQGDRNAYWNCPAAVASEPQLVDLACVAEQFAGHLSAPKPHRRRSA